MKRIFSSPDSSELSLFKSMLEQANVPCVLRHEQISQTIPVLAFEAELWVVKDEDYPKASSLVEAWCHSPPGAGEAWVCPVCGEKIEGQFTACWKCGAKREPTAIA